MSMRVHVNPALLAWACERAGYDVDAFVARFPKLRDWLRGDAQPTLKQLEVFAKTTRAPLGYFFLPEPPEERVPIPDFRAMQGSTGRPSPELLETLYTCQQRQDWYRDFARTNGEDRLAFVGSARLGDDVVEVATSIRSALGFDVEARRQMGTWSDALREFIAQADAAGIMVMCSGVVLNNNNRPLNPAEFRGFAMADELAPLIFVNGKDTKAAQMFTLAHELAHVWLGQSAVSDAEAGRIADHVVERWCNHVAAELLVSLALMRGEYRPAAPLRDELDRLARRFKVSTLVVLRRVHDLGALSRTQLWTEYERELTRLSSVATGSGGNFYLTQAARVSKRFARALVVSTLEGQTLYRDAYRMLGFHKQSTFEALGHSLGVL